MVYYTFLLNTYWEDDKYFFSDFVRKGMSGVELLLAGRGGDENPIWESDLGRTTNILEQKPSYKYSNILVATFCPHLDDLN